MDIKLKLRVHGKSSNIEIGQVNVGKLTFRTDDDKTFMVDSELKNISKCTKDPLILYVLLKDAKPLELSGWVTVEHDRLIPKFIVDQTFTELNISVENTLRRTTMNVDLLELTLQDDEGIFSYQKDKIDQFNAEGLLYYSK